MPASRVAAAALIALGLLPGLAPAAPRITLPPGAPSVDIPFRLVDHRPFVEVTIEGRGPYRFVFDTGGSNVLDLAVAESLGLALREPFDLPGAGDGTAPAWRTTVGRLDVGGIAIDDHEFLVFSLEPIRRAIDFERLDGLIGRELLERFVVGLDFEAGRLRVAPDQAAFDVPASARRVVIDFPLGGVPAVEGALGGRPARFAIDTGDRSALTLFVPFVEEHRLRTRLGPATHLVTGWGVGGPIPADVVRAPRVGFGGFVARDIETRLPRVRSGAFASGAVSGSVGTRFLQRFGVIFDYRARELVLWPNRRFAAPDRTDRSGSFLVRDEAGIRVASVATGSPAERSGLREGDRLVEADGVAADGLSLIELRERWAQPGAGQTRLVVERAGAGRRAIVLRLAPARTGPPVRSR